MLWSPLNELLWDLTFQLQYDRMSSESLYSIRMCYLINLTESYISYPPPPYPPPYQKHSDCWHFCPNTPDQSTSSSSFTLQVLHNRLDTHSILFLLNWRQTSAAAASSLITIMMMSWLNFYRFEFSKSWDASQNLFQYHTRRNSPAGMGFQWRPMRILYKSKATLDETQRNVTSGELWCAQKV